MAAKKKTVKNTRAKAKKIRARREQQDEIRQWIAVVILFGLLLMSSKRWGVVGISLYNLQRYLIGDFYWLIEAFIIAWVLINIYNRRHDDERENPAPLILVICAVLLIAAYVFTKEEGFASLMQFTDHIKDYFSLSFTGSTGGGIAGALLFGITTLAFGRNGALVVIASLLIIATFFFGTLKIYKSFFHSVWNFVKIPEKEEEEVIEAEPEEPEEPINMWNKLDEYKQRRAEEKKAKLGTLTADAEEPAEEDKAELNQPVNAYAPLEEKSEDEIKNEETDHLKILTSLNDQPKQNMPDIRGDEDTEQMDLGNIPSKNSSIFLKADETPVNHAPVAQKQVYVENTEPVNEQLSFDPDTGEIQKPAKEMKHARNAEVVRKETNTADMKHARMPEPAQVGAPAARTAEPAPEKTEKKSDKSNKIAANDARALAAYKLPKIQTCLDEVVRSSSNIENEKAAREEGEALIQILHNFDIDAQLLDTHIGPAVTQFEIKPAATVKVSRILGLTDNIKMQLAARDIRIEAPIPGRNAIGIEVPNVASTPVKMKELVKNYNGKDKDKPLLIYLGKDLLGQTVTCRLDKMPHLLIAGATGSGKSVCMNSIITSILLRTRPDDVKLLLVDPKKVEFTPYRDVPHLIGPIINDPNQASNALKVIVRIMDERYNIFAASGVRNIEGFNQKVIAQNGAKNPDGSPAPKKLPYIVVIIDELADLMAVAGKEVEGSIQRITQLARAAGIHLIVATQRPSTDVITGIIKANIPSRIAFSVSSGIDSRTILDHVGAERLLGNGDMLYMPIGQNSATRVQGVFVTDQEVQKITDFVKAEAYPVYDDSFVLLEGINDMEGAGGMMSVNDDPMFTEVKNYVIEAQKASTSLLQRRFGIGYNRAARMIDALEQAGVIGPAQGSKPREVFIKPEKDTKKTETGDMIE